MSDAYARAGVDTREAARAIAALVEVLSTIDTGRPPRSLLRSGHYAAVLELSENIGLAICTDGVGSKVIVAEQTGRFDTVGIDCVAMNVNDLICVGAQPLALVDYIAVEEAQEDMLRALAVGLKRGAELAGVEIPGGEVAQLPELIAGHPSPRGFDLTATCVGTVALDHLVTGSHCAPGDALIGLPSSGLHSNGYTLARRALLDHGGFALDDAPPELEGASVADALLEPTTIYVRAVMALLHSPIPVHGLAHVTGDGLLNLMRLQDEVGFRVDSPLPAPPVFALVQERGGVGDAEMHEVFNMGCGFCCVVPDEHASAAIDVLAREHPGTARIGSLTDQAGTIEIVGAGLVGDRGGLRPG
jgi:phosphoribosylformylglycinamidine cyclo-ligase